MNEQDLRNRLKRLEANEAEIRRELSRTSNQARNDTPPSPALRYTWLGAEFAAIFIGFIWGGYTLDQRLGTKPWLLLAGIGFGFGLALYRLIFVAKKLGS